ncbi:PX [Musa troglodytarum]|uniref:PX n=1 Tax=Musa troglodytarum TaxID=320322 RepID=A0A9E7HTZ1_9LILI|nr:PX [Musa troglodytarum]
MLSSPSPAPPKVSVAAAAAAAAAAACNSTAETASLGKGEKEKRERPERRQFGGVASPRLASWRLLPALPPRSDLISLVSISTIEARSAVFPPAGHLRFERRWPRTVPRSTATMGPPRCPSAWTGALPRNVGYVRLLLIPPRSPLPVAWIHVGIQSPEGISTSHGLLRRFSDFLKLYSALKKTFPRRDIPAAPPKHAFLRINASRMLLEERRRALEEWMGKLLSDIEFSRSAPVAGFLELEVAARSAFQYVNNHPTEPSSTDSTAAPSLIPARPSSSASVADCSKIALKSHTVATKSPSMPSDICSENVDETSDLETPRKGKIREFDTSTEDLTFHDVSNGILGESFLDQPEDFIKSKLNQRRGYLVSERETTGGSSFRDRIESISSDHGHDKLYGHARRLSSESVGSDISSIRGSELSFTGAANSLWDGSLDVPVGAEIPNAMDAFAGLGGQSLDSAQIVLPIDQRHKLNRVLLTMQRRLGTAKTDMEDLIARLNQEMAVKEYLTTKVKDLEVELEATEQKGKENLQQAIFIERERVTQMQWDMDELRRKCSEMESKLKLEQNEKSRAELEKMTASDEKEVLLQELGSKQEELLNMRKHLGEQESKSKADIKVLVKEVKFLRKSQAELKELLNQTLKEKSELEGFLHKEKQKWSNAKSASKNLLHECRVLRDWLQECIVNFLADEEDKFTISPSSLSDALDLLATSDNRIGLLLAEAQLLARNDEEACIDDDDDAQTSEFSGSGIASNGENPMRADDNDDDDEMRSILTDMFIDNARLRKQVNSVIRCALNTVIKPEREESNEVSSRKTVLNRFLER